MKAQRLTAERTMHLLRMVDKRSSTHTWILDQVGEALADHLRTFVRKPKKKRKRKKLVPADR